MYREAGRLHEAGEHLIRARGDWRTADLSFEYRAALDGGRRRIWSRAALFRNPVEDQPYDPENWLWLARAHAELGLHEDAVATIRQGLSKVDPSGQFAPPAEKLPETAAVRATEIKRSERAPLLGVMAESLIRLGRADEALPALDEAVAAAPKDALAGAVRAEAQAPSDGTAREPGAQPTFDRDGVVGTPDPMTGRSRPTMTTMLNEVPTISEGTARLRATGRRRPIAGAGGLGAGPGHAVSPDGAAARRGARGRLGHTSALASLRTCARGHAVRVSSGCGRVGDGLAGGDGRRRRRQQSDHRHRVRAEHAAGCRAPGG